ncbi:MAG: OPT/YSL family transporter [Deltaproteobacteria bacterium]|nr:OPT/YSL family transporter [Deltaproteobacteria bacterium]
MASEDTGSTAAPFPIDPVPLRDPEAIAARDRLWLEQVYQKDEPQLTFRAAITGMTLGAILSASNLYIGLKIGWSFGMGITSAVVGFAIFAALRGVFPGMRPLSMLENNTSQTAASAAAYMSSAGLVSSIPAMAMLRKDGTISIPDLDGYRLAAWMLGVSVLGVVVAVPLKRNMINAEQLRFPGGVVCAETIRTMHSAGRASMAKARSLFAAAIGAAALKLALESKPGFLRRIPEVIPFPGSLRGHGMGAWSLGANTSLLLYAAGAIVGVKVATSLLIGAVLDYAIVAPWLVDHGVLRVAPPEIAADPARWLSFAKAAEAVHAIPVKVPDALHATLRSKWSVWPGTAIMVSSSIVAFAFRWRTVARAFSGLSGMFRRGAARNEDPLASVEVPQSWFALGLAACAVACVYMQWAWFAVPILEGTVSVAAAFLLSVVAARATGETGVTPIGAMGKITQLLFGVLVPGNAAANLMTATVTAGAASHSADLLMEVKTGYLLGGSPRKQFWAQMLGVLAGAAVCVPVYFLVAKPEKLGNELAAPAAVAWASVAKLLKDGAKNLPTLALAGIVVGASIGVLIAVLEEIGARQHAREVARFQADARLPDRDPDAKPPPKPAWTTFVPSATGLGIALVIDFNDSFAMFLGALAAWSLLKKRKELADRYTVSVASGVIAGEGLMGIVVIFLRDVVKVL